MDRTDFSDQKNIIRYKRIKIKCGDSLHSYLVFYPITVNNYASLLNSTPVGRTSFNSDFQVNDGPDLKLFI